MSSKFSNFYVFIFRIIFGRTCYGTTVFGLTTLFLLVSVDCSFQYQLKLHSDVTFFYAKDAF